MLIQNPAAKRAGTAFLEDHRLDFNYMSTRWGGYAATIVPDKGKRVFGAVWEITDLESLDDQEGVSSQIYFAKQVNVVKANNETIQCRTYQLVDLPSNANVNEPSRIYLETILQGAIESRLPEPYIAQLKRIRHNNFVGPITISNFNITIQETVELPKNISYGPSISKTVSDL